LEKERDISIRTIADQAGKLLGHILFVKIKWRRRELEYFLVIFNENVAKTK
jgi:hypothetical protein